MKPVYVVADNIVSPLGLTASENFSRLVRGDSSVREHGPGAASSQPFVGSLFDESFWQQHQQPGWTRFESLLVASISNALETGGIQLPDPRTGLVISSTKGNISLIEQEALTPGLKTEIGLFSSAKKIATHLGFEAPPVIISHACISGLVALITARRMIQAGRFDRVVVAGADLITRFILSGFQSFQAVSDQLCKPFDADRKGINLGEAAATIVLVASPPEKGPVVQLSGGAVSNDANHISGPSRTGQELFLAIDQAMRQAGVGRADLDFVSLHGTATLYNDDMESKAIHLAGLSEVPVNSLKGYYGHTLGAAGLVESVISLHSLEQNIIIPTKGFERPGTAEIMQVCSTLQHAVLRRCLKTASGFGGCNAAVVFEKL